MTRSHNCGLGVSHGFLVVCRYERPPFRSFVRSTYDASRGVCGAAGELCRRRPPRLHPRAGWGAGGARRCGRGEPRERRARAGCAGPENGGRALARRLPLLARGAQGAPEPALAAAGRLCARRVRARAGRRRAQRAPRIRGRPRGGRCHGSSKWHAAARSDDRGPCSSTLPGAGAWFELGRRCRASEPCGSARGSRRTASARSAS